MADPQYPKVPAPNLDAVQRWFQEVVTHADGVEAGVESAAASQLIPLNREQIEQVIRRSARLSAVERLNVYANAYYVRLLECLKESFPVLLRALGEEVFNTFALEYLKRYPSRSYTLNRLGASFPAFLDETRPDRPADGSEAPVDWPDFLIDVARLEWEIESVFDGPGVENQPLLQAAAIHALRPEQWSRIRLAVVPCLRLLAFRFPVNDYFTAARAGGDGVGGDLAIPSDEPQFLALNRRNFIVKRHPLSYPQYILLGGIVAGKTLMECVELAADATDADDDKFAVMLAQWFEAWTESGFFVRLKSAI